jgi:uncharacterized protein
MKGHLTQKRKTRGFKMGLDDIYYFARSGKVDSIQKAVNSGMDINKKDEFGVTALQYSIAFNQVNVAHFLLSLGADVTIQDNDGLTAVHYAVEYSLSDILIALLQKCPQALEISNKYGNQPLWTAIAKPKDDLKLVSLLLDFGADVDHLNNVNLSPLDILKRKKSPLLDYIKQRIASKLQ